MACAGYEPSGLAWGYVSNLVCSPPVDDFEQASPAEKRDSSQLPAAPESITPPEWIDLYRRDKAFSSFVNDILSLFYEECEVAPDSHVVDWVLRSFVLSKRLLAQKWTAPRVATDEAGGLRLSWRQGTREVRAVVPADLSARYLYWQTKDNYGGEPNFGSGTLYARLQWLNEPDTQQ